MKEQKLFCTVVAICVLLFWAMQLGCLRGSEDTNREDNDVSDDDVDDDADDDAADDDVDDDVDDDIDDDADDDSDDDADDDVDDDTDDDVDDDSDDDSDDDTDDDADDDVDDDTDDDTCEAYIELIDGDSEHPANGHTSLAIDADDALHVGYQKTSCSYDCWYPCTDCSAADFLYATNKTGDWDKSVVDSAWCYLHEEPHYYHEYCRDMGSSNEIALDDSGSPRLIYNSKYYEHYRAWFPRYEEYENYITEGKLKYTPIPPQIQTLASDYEENFLFPSGANYTGSANSMVIDHGAVYIVYNNWDYTDSYGNDYSFLSYISGLDSYDIYYCSGRIGYTSIGIDSNSYTHIAFTCGSLKYATNSSGSWEIATIASADYPSLAIDSNDFVHISYRQSGHLMYATNKSGAWVTTTVDASGNVGDYNSLVLDADDHAHISYYDKTNSNLKYATNASGAWNICIVDSEGDVGKNTSIALDSEGVVHIVYTGEDSLWHAVISQGGFAD